MMNTAHDVGVHFVIVQFIRFHMFYIKRKGAHYVVYLMLNYTMIQACASLSSPVIQKLSKSKVIKFEYHTVLRIVKCWNI
jgi:hypothetical protein